MSRRLSTPEETITFLQSVTDAVIKPNAQRIAEITARRRIPIAVFDPGPLNRRFLQEAGWDGHSPVFAMPKAIAKVMENVDRVTGRWLRRSRGPVRIYLAMHDGSLLVNFGDEGFYLEPGSTDVEMETASAVQHVEELVAGHVRAGATAWAARGGVA